MSQWLTGIPFQNLSRWWRELKLHVIDLKEQHPMVLHLTNHELFNIEIGSVNEACAKKMCIVLVH